MYHKFAGILFLVYITSITTCNAQTSYMIGTGRGVLTAVGGTIKEEPFNPYSVGKYNQLWTFTVDPRFPNGSFFSCYAKVWDAEGYRSTPNTNVFLYAKKTTLAETRNQRWIWTPTHQIYPVMNTSAYVTVSEDKCLRLEEKRANDPRQIFYPVEAKPITATIRNYLTNPAQIVISTPFGSYNFSNERYLSFPVLKGYTIHFRDSQGSSIRVSHPVCKNDIEANGINIVLGSPSFPSGMKSWALYRTDAKTKKVQKFMCNITILNNQFTGSAREVTVYFDSARGVNATKLGAAIPIIGSSQPNGNIHLYFSFVNHFRGTQFDGIYYFSSYTSASIKGTWGDMDVRHDRQTIGDFELVLTN